MKGWANVNMPRFTAETSLYKTSGYRTGRRVTDACEQVIDVIRPAVAKEEEEVGEVIFVEGALPIRFPDWGGGGGGGAPAPFRGDSPGRGGGGGGSGSRPTKWPNFSPAE